MKTPEEMAEEWSRTPRPNQDVDEYQLSWDFVCEWEKESFLAGYQAAKDEYKVAIDTYNDVAKQMLEEAVRIMSPKDQLADADKVMPQWISVHKQLPEEDTGVLAFINYTVENEPIRRVTFGAFRGGLWLTDNEILAHPLVSHWMPLPAPPKEEK